MLTGEQCWSNLIYFWQDAIFLSGARIQVTRSQLRNSSNQITHINMPNLLAHSLTTGCVVKDVHTSRWGVVWLALMMGKDHQSESNFYLQLWERMFPNCRIVQVSLYLKLKLILKIAFMLAIIWKDRNEEKLITDFRYLSVFLCLDILVKGFVDIIGS